MLAIHITDSHPWGSLRSKPVHAHARLHTLKRSIHQVIQVVRIPQKSPWKGGFGWYFNNESQKKKKYHEISIQDTCVVSFKLLWKIVMSPCHCSNFRCPNVGKRREPTTMGSRAIWTPEIYRTLQFKDTSTNINRDISIISTYINYRWCMMYPKCHLELNTKKYSTVLESISCWSWTLKVVQKPWSFGTLPTLPLTPLSTDF